MKKGLREFGAKGKEVAMKEMQQHHDMSTFKPVHAKDLSQDEKRKALRSLIFLKQKPNGDVKGRHCADGRPQRQRETMIKDDTTSSRVMNEHAFITWMYQEHSSTLKQIQRM